MAVRIKKREPESPAAGVPEQVFIATQETFSWLQDHRNLVLGLVGAGVVAIVVAALVVDGVKSRKIKQSTPVFQAIAASTAPVGEGGVYATRAERSAAVTELASAASDNPVALLLLAEAALADGRSEDASAAYGRAGSYLGAFEQSVLAFGTASAQAEAGALEQALGALDHVAVTNASFAAPARLHAAQLTDAFGAPEAALDAYRRYLEAHADGPGRALAQNRAAQLEIALNVPPASE